MRRRRLILLLGIALIAGCCVVVAFWPRPQSPINRENFEAIQDGMSKADVEMIFGLPPGDYTTGPIVPVVGNGILTNSAEPNRSRDIALQSAYFWMAMGSDDPLWERWQSDSGVCNVHFNANERVIWKDFQDCERAPESLLVKLKRWLRLE